MNNIPCFRSLEQGLFRIISYFKKKYYLSSSERYINYLRMKGVAIGTGCSIRPKSTSIDLTRPSLISIGNNCYMNEHFTLMTHDWVSHVFINSGREFINSSGKVTIGNNVGFGINVIVLKGVTIGNNVFIGAGSIVTKSIPSDCIAVGVPCKPVVSLDEFYKKRKEVSYKEAKEYALSIMERYGRRPQVEDFWEEFPLFCKGSDINKYPSLPIKKQLGPSYEMYISSHEPMFNDFESFLDAIDGK